MRFSGGFWFVARETDVAGGRLLVEVFLVFRGVFLPSLVGIGPKKAELWAVKRFFDASVLVAGEFGHAERNPSVGTRRETCRWLLPNFVEIG